MFGFVDGWCFFLAGWLAVWLAGWLAGGCLAVWLVVCFLAGWLTGWLAGSLVGWLAGFARGSTNSVCLGPPSVEAVSPARRVARHTFNCSTPSGRNIYFRALFPLPPLSTPASTFVD